MIAMTLADIAAVVDGQLGGGADPTSVVTGPVAFDSRQVTAGGLFLALPGERADGHDYVGVAGDRGAVAAMVTRPVASPHVLVGDGSTALAALARHVGNALQPELTVVAVTGSSGKTSTKDLLAQLLPALGPTVAPRDSFNNELGYPYTVLHADRQTRYLVLEASARAVGDIRYLTAILAPRIAAVLNVGSAHLGVFGSREAIAAAKGELVEALPPAHAGGVAVLNADDPLVRAMADRTQARVLMVGESPAAQLRAERVHLDATGRARFELVTGDVRAPVALQLVGAHHVGNALAAAALATECGMSVPHIAAALGRATPASRWRMEVHERPDGVTVINDAYNANPESMRAALKTLAALRGEGRRVWAVLGPMAELGAQAGDEHDRIGRLVVRLSLDKLIAVGQDARPIFTGASLEGSWNGEAGWQPSIDAALGVLREQLLPGDVVLVKASRAAGLERLAQALLTQEPVG